MAEITFFEFHLHDGFEFSPLNKAPFIGGGSDAEDESYDEAESVEIEEFEDEASGEESSGGPSAFGALVGFVLLVGLAALARKFLSGDDEMEELDDLAETAAEATA